MNGFTLLELSIAMLVMGFLIGGIMVGRDMILSATNRSVMKDYTKYSSAVTLFRERYQAFPGDLRTATRFWGIKAGTGSDDACYDATSTALPTCNGNADGLIGAPYNAAVKRTEMFLFWQHLANAELVDSPHSGVFTGKEGAGGVLHHVVASNSPDSKIAGAGWSAFTQTLRTVGQTDFFETHDGEADINHFLFGREVAANLLWSPALTPQQAYDIDMKMDDSHPARGVVEAPKSTNANAPLCTTGASAATAAYNMAYEEMACFLLFYKPF